MKLTVKKRTRFQRHRAPAREIRRRIHRVIGCVAVIEVAANEMGKSYESEAVEARHSAVVVNILRAVDGAGVATSVALMFRKCYVFCGA